MPGFLQSFLQSGLQQRKEDPPELEILAGLLMSGRLDSNQRPPEPHSGALAKLRHAPSVAGRFYFKLWVPWGLPCGSGNLEEF